MKKTGALLLCAVLTLSLFSAVSAAEPPESAAADAATGWYANYLKSAEAADWDVVTLASAGEAVRTRSEQANRLVSLAAAQNREALPLALLSMMALGGSPYVDGTQEIAALLGGGQGEDGAFSYLSSTVYAVVALENAQPALYDRAAAKNYILSQQLSDGGFAFFGDKGDVDMTGMTLLALSFFKSEADADRAIERAKDFLYSTATANGGYISAWSEKGVENANSVATAISGLIAVGEEPSGGRLRPLIDNLLSFQLPDGGFAYEAGDNTSNYYATQQALLALSDVLNGKSWINRLSWTASVENTLAGVSDGAEIPAWARGFASEAYGMGLFKGDDSGRFLPQRALTRAEFCVLLLRVAGDAGEYSAPYYVDVQPDDWYYEAVSRVAAKGLMGGAEGRFLPDEPVTRGEAARVLAALLGLPLGTVLPLDLNTADRGLADGISAVIAAGIMTGDGKGVFRPCAPLSRAEAAKLFVAAAARYSET